MNSIYQVDTSLQIVLDEYVTKPYHQHHNSAWVKEVVQKDNRYHRNAILDRGRADFTASYNGITPDQKVLLYCSNYLQMHLASHHYLYDVCHDICEGNTAFLTENSIFIDFGCGPLTSALALANYATNVGKKRLKCHYIGIDRAPAMLDKARQFSQNSTLFSPESRFRFLTDYRDEVAMLKAIEEYASRLSEPYFIFNFSYFFASPWLDPAAISALIDRLLYNFSNIPYAIFFQNPPGYGLNRNWLSFKRHLQSPVEVVERSSIDNGKIVYYNDYPLARFSRWTERKEIKLYYEILFS